MLFTRETDYAMRLVRNLSEGAPTSISTIVEKEYISNAIAYKVARKLEKGGLIRSVRGNAGGYMLTRPLTEITLLDIYRIMDPTSMLNECLREGAHCPVNEGASPCQVHKELVRIQAVLFAELASKSVAELIES